MEIVMARGDRETRTFRIMTHNEQGEPVPYTAQFDEIYMTVKRSETDRSYKFQKRLTNGTIIALGNGEYQFTIEPEDTDGLSFDEYGFDIEVVIENEIKKTFSGVLVLNKEYTHACNEGAPA